MDVSQSDHGTSEIQRKGPGKRGGASAPPDASQPSAPCGACRFLRRKCVSGCIFAPHFNSDQGAARFAAVHKVFGASNVSKLLLHIPANRRHDAVVTITYEAQARLSDPVHGCVSTIMAMQQQVASLEAELAMVQTQLMNSRFALANAQQQQPNHIPVMQPAYSSISSASNNLVDMNSFNTSFQLAAACENPHQSHGFAPLQLTRPPSGEIEQESLNLVAFANHIFN